MGRFVTPRSLRLSSSPSAKEHDRANTLAVDDVHPAENPIWTEALSEHVAKRLEREVLLLPEPQKPVTNILFAPYASWTLSPVEMQALEKRMICRSHSLIDAVDTAFSQHYPLTLSPDSIWLVIEQGFANHVSENAEALRHRLVQHEGSTKLTAKVRDVTLTSLQLAIEDFSSQIRQATDPVLHETLVCDFSTTTPAIRTASEVVLMDCYASYFEYEIACVCGIPKITILGSLEDWQRIRARVEVLASFGLGWWVERLRPILDEFIETVSGHHNRKFWQAIYKPRHSYGVEAVTGWIADLFPYLNDAPKRCRNHIFQYERKNWAIPVSAGVKTRLGFRGSETALGVNLTSFPSGIASVPAKLVFESGPTIEVDLVAGFLAVEQNPQDLALSPVVSWLLTRQPCAEPLLSEHR